MKVKVGKKREIHFLWIFGVSIALVVGSLVGLQYGLHYPFLNLFFGGFAVLLLIVLAYYWMNSSGYYNNLGRIRRTFYTMFLLFMAWGIVTGKLDLANWQLLTELTALAVFVDLSVFQNPNILKVWSAEFKHEDEVREALKDSKKTILKNSKKVEKFSQVIQFTDVHFENQLIPVNMKEYQEQLEKYLELYRSTFGFSISCFLFDSPTEEEQKRNNIETQIENISVRHAINFSREQEEKDKMITSFSNGETLILEEEKLIAIPYFGDFYSMIITIEAKDVAVDGIDASHISNLVYIFDWYMTDAGEEDDV